MIIHGAIFLNEKKHLAFLFLLAISSSFILFKQISQLCWAHWSTLTTSFQFWRFAYNDAPIQGAKDFQEVGLEDSPLQKEKWGGVTASGNLLGSCFYIVDLCFDDTLEKAFGDICESLGCRMWFLQQSWTRELSLRRRPIQMKQVRDIKDHWNNQDHKPEVFPGHQIKSIYRVWWVNSQCATTQDILGYCSFKGISFTMLKPPQACNMPRLLGSKHQLLSDTRHFQRFSMLKDHQHDLFTHGCLKIRGPLNTLLSS